MGQIGECLHPVQNSRETVRCDSLGDRGGSTHCPTGVTANLINRPGHMTRESQLEEMKRDWALVARCLRGDECAWETILDLYGKRIYNLCVRLTGGMDEAEDLTQEIFIRAYENLRSFRSETGSFRGWLFRVGRNLIVDQYRRERRSRASLVRQELESLRLEDSRTPSPQRVAELEEASRFIEQGMSMLAPAIKRAVELREMEGMSYCEIARIVGVSEGTVKSRISRGRLQLERILTRRHAQPWPAVPVAV